MEAQDIALSKPQVKIVLVLIDGLSDLNHKDIGGKQDL
jgi:2,3-bisphosphoglycerate-independent phosphoglycerate mutase